MLTDAASSVIRDDGHSHRIEFVRCPDRRGFSEVYRYRARTGARHGHQAHRDANGGPVGRGTRWRETPEIMGVTDSADMEVTSFERNRTYTIRHRKAGVQIAATFWFEPVDRSTKVSIEFELDPGGLPTWALAPLGWVIEGKSNRSSAMTSQISSTRVMNPCMAVGLRSRRPRSHPAIVLRLRMCRAGA